MAIEELDATGLDQVLRDERRTVLVDYWSPWCAPCRQLRPHLERLADEYREDARIVAVNIEEQDDVRERFDVTALPTLMLFKGGEIERRFTGPTLPSDLASALDTLAGR